jgi:hypothetical protein
MIREKLFWRGAALGLILPVMGFIGYASIYMDGDISGLYVLLQEQQVHTHVMSLCTLINIVPFFIFIKANRDKPAQGILMVTILLALFIFSTKLF